MVALIAAFNLSSELQATNFYELVVLYSLYGNKMKLPQAN